MTDNVLELGAQLATLFNDQEPQADFRWSVVASSSPISEVFIGDDALTIRFENGAHMSLKDNGQSCCENRYMSCDDDLASIKGGYLRSVVIEDGPSQDGDYGDCHDQQFLKVRTTNGDFTAVTHNEHNGYYGGFSITAQWQEP